jgi:hypothetical protein
MANEFKDRLDRKHVNDHCRVQNKPERKEFNVKRVVRRVNTNVDEFVADNTDIRDVYFENVSVRNGEHFG